VSDEQQDPTFSQAMAEAMRKTRLANGITDDAPMGQALLGSIGGVRGIIESVVPTLIFLVLHLILNDVVISTLIPVGVALVFVVARAGTRSPMSSAITGAVILGVTAVLAIVTNKAENNFIPGIVLNSVFVVAFLVSILVRWPLVGVIVSMLLGERAEGWRGVPRQRRALTIATWVWVVMYAIRVIIEVPLYLVANASGLAIAKLILGIPLYAIVLLASWLLIRSVFPVEPAAPDDGEPKVS
jgi:hypothetical protein